MKLTTESEKIDSKLLVRKLPKNFDHNYYCPKSLMNMSQSLSRLSLERMRMIMWTPELRNFWEKTIELYKKDPEMKYLNTFETPTQELRDNTNYMFTKAWKNLEYDYSNYKKNPIYMAGSVITNGFVNMAAGTKVGVHFGLYTKSLLSLGTKKHEIYIERAFNLTDYGCFMLTEMGHGSNVQGILTTATYDHSTRSFTLNTPLDQGMKFWIGNLAQTANMGIVFANLLINGQNEGVHAFLVRLRENDGTPRPGIIIGDCGMKMGVNGMDNGWALFKSLRVGVDSLLDNFTWIDENGSIQSKIKSKSKRFAVQITALSGGRLAISLSAAMATLQGCGIALRYGMVRKQFGERKGMENTLAEYPLVHSKLVTRITNALVYYSMADFLDYASLNVDIFDLGNAEVKELHALSCFIKTASTWNLKNGLLRARELCGGHGFSAYSHMPTLVNDNEVHVTWDGTNEVLLQQTCKNLLQEFQIFRSKSEINFKTLQFLRSFSEGQVDLNKVFEDFHIFVGKMLTGAFSDALRPPSQDSAPETKDSALAILRFLEALADNLEVLLQLRLYEMVDKSLAKFAQFLTLVNSTKNNFIRSFNKTLPHVLFPAAIFYGELVCFSTLKHNLGFIGDQKSPFLFKTVPHFQRLDEAKFLQEKIYCTKVLIVFAASTLANSAQFLIDAHESADITFFDSLHEIGLKLTDSMRFDSLTVADMFLPGDIIQTSIGSRDGDIFRNIQRDIFSRQSNFGKSPQTDTIRKLLQKARKSSIEFSNKV